MGHDNWAICPRCNEKQQKEQEKLARKVENSYGQIPQEEWLNLKSKLDNPMVPDYTLAEDYALGIREGEFVATYTARCRICGFTYEYRHREPIN